jgi:hypothetical protein
VDEGRRSRRVVGRRIEQGGSEVGRPELIPENANCDLFLI